MNWNSLRVKADKYWLVDLHRKADSWMYCNVLDFYAFVHGIKFVKEYSQFLSDFFFPFNASAVRVFFYNWGFLVITLSFVLQLYSQDKEWSSISISDCPDVFLPSFSCKWCFGRINSNHTTDCCSSKSIKSSWSTWDTERSGHRHWSSSYLRIPILQAKNVQLARLSREENLSNLKLRVDEKKIISVSSLRGVARLVICAGPAPFILESFKLSEPFTQSLLDRGVLVVPFASNGNLPSFEFDEGEEMKELTTKRKRLWQLAPIYVSEWSK